MKKISLALALCASIAVTGCGNLTPEQNAALGGAILGGLAVAGAVAAARQPVYYQPVYVVPVRTCNRWGRCW